jgi:hypothetical protein
MGHLYRVTVSEPNATSSTEKLVLRALIFSVLLHLLVVSIWREGQARGWWRNLAMPRWMQLISTAMMPLTPKKLAADLPSQTQLAFVEVDPTLAKPEPPKKPMFEGAKNTLAANREIKVLSEKPNIDGLQEKYLKTTEDAKWLARLTNSAKESRTRKRAIKRSPSPSRNRPTTNLAPSPRRWQEVAVQAD